MALLSFVLLFAACTAAPAPTPTPTAPAAAPATSSAAAPAAPAAPTPTGSPAARGEPVTLKFTDLRITSMAGYYIAQERGYFGEEGIRLEFEPTAAADLVPLVISGQVDLGGGAIAAGLFNAFARGINARIVADAGRNLDQASAGGVVYRKDLYDSGALRGAADLRGRKVAVTTQGSAPDIALDRFLGTAGLSLADVDLTVLQFPDMLPAFDNRAIDAAYYQEPFTTLAVERGMVVRGPIGYDIYPDQQIGVTLFGERMLSDRPLSQRYMRAYVRGVRDYVMGIMERDPALFDIVVPILIEHTTVKERSLYERAIPSGLSPDPIPNLESIAADQEWYLANGFQQQRVNVAEIVDTSFVEQAIRDLGRVR